MEQKTAAGKRKAVAGRVTGEDGQAALELALVLPMLLLLVTGMCTYGLSLRSYMVLTDATNEAARQLAVSRGQTVDPCWTAAYSIINAAPSLNTNYMTLTISLNGNTYTGPNCSSASTYSGAAGNLTINTPAVVTLNYSLCSFAMFGRPTTACTLTATTTELVQ
ncbi:TadE/TadG family type IV pilus assembly protein [Granulicella tundricola]|uniref:TadE family protein n=1 Tax=Granulicella tundricola (strain ATCC BAA-1859 / DSM 23138 / MP5ACTX9) TaxID=1198114 RepID=E8WY53_GRATM|nr:TadE/TadG family type IV pilus assembly protein [Granulicella tundricola]ADW68680.1 TadE family protein [Granulicella tundricola MP5ACTX9]